MRPQFGSPPCSAALTSGELATARATRSTVASSPPVHVHAADPLRALAVAHDLQREPAQRVVERLPQAQLVLGLRRDDHAARARGHQHRRVVGGELPVDGDAVERALDAHAEQQVGGLGLERRVGLHEAEHGREARLDHPRALGLGADPHGAGRAARRRATGASRTRRWWRSRARTRRRRPARARRGRRGCRAGRRPSAAARRSRRSRRRRRGPRARRRPSRRRPACARRPRARGCRWRRSRCPS